MAVGPAADAELLTDIAKWGKGDHILRVYRGSELLAEGHFTFN